MLAFEAFATHFCRRIENKHQLETMNKMIAYCGLDCEKCDAYIATITNDNELRRKTAQKWSELNGVEITAEMINCVGCRTNGVKTPYCEQFCAIRKCAVGKDLETCGNCRNLQKCQTVGMILSNNDSALHNLKNSK